MFVTIRIDLGLVIFLFSFFVSFFYFVSVSVLLTFELGGIWGIYGV